MAAKRLRQGGSQQPPWPRAGDGGKIEQILKEVSKMASLLMRWGLVLLFAVWLSPVASAMEPTTTGVVLLHGKWGDSSNVRPVRTALEEAGFTVDTPTMPWAGNRLFDRNVDGAMEEISASIARLKGRGAVHIVVAGHSLGGSAALRFGTIDGSLAAVVLIAPAHFPEGRGSLDKAADSVARARAMVEGGEGASVGSFLSLNSGNRTRLLPIAAATYLSYYDPAGPAAMSLFAPRMKAVPVLWVAPSADPTTETFARLVVPNLPTDVSVRRMDVSADHMGAPQAGAAAIVSWLKDLPD
jgi:pimeloyl-ACP methyl ester carboxylesterase